MERIAEAFEMFLDRHGHFFRTRTRHNVAVARRYLRGLAQAEDCTFESMAAVVEGGCAQQFQHFISCSPWDHEPVVAQIGQDADRLLGDKPTSALIIDESSFPKQGDRSVGVARQWTGRLGKIDNCQMRNPSALPRTGPAARDAPRPTTECGAGLAYRPRV